MMKYVFAGGTAALVEWSCFGISIGVAHLHYLAAVMLSFVLATGVNYILSSRFVFSSGRHPAHKEIVLLYVVSAVGLVSNLLLMSFFVGVLSVPAMPAKIASTGIIFVWNFTARKIWIFSA